MHLLQNITAITGSGASDDPAIVSTLHPAPRGLSDYRQERNLSILDFTDMLGIMHQEYTHVIQRLPVDPRLRDQIAFKLGAAPCWMNWRMYQQYAAGRDRSRRVSGRRPATRIA